MGSKFVISNPHTMLCVAANYENTDARKIRHKRSETSENEQTPPDRTTDQLSTPSCVYPRIITHHFAGIQYCTVYLSSHQHRWCWSAFCPRLQRQYACFSSLHAWKWTHSRASCPTRQHPYVEETSSFHNRMQSLLPKPERLQLQLHIQLHVLTQPHFSKFKMILRTNS